MNYYNSIDINLYNKQVSIIITRFKNRLLEDIEFNALFSNKNYEKEVNDLTLNINEDNYFELILTISFVEFGDAPSIDKLYASINVVDTKFSRFIEISPI